MKPKRILDLLKETFQEWTEDKAPRMAAALAYYSIFSLAPLLILAVGVSGLVFGEKAAQGEIVGQIKDVVGLAAAEAIETLLKDSRQSGGVLATVIGLGVLLFGASGVFVELQDSLNTIWKVTPKPGRLLVGILRERFLSIVLVFGTGFLLLASVGVSMGLTALGKFVHPGALPGGTYLWQALNQVVSFAIVTVLFAMIYKVLPDAHIPWRDVWTGAAVTSLLFTAGKYLIGLYLALTSTNSAFGAAGSVVVILLWVYYSSLIFLFGAELTRVVARRRGERITPTENALPVSVESLARQGMVRAPEPGTTAQAR